jgi:hypothetical protein
LRIFVFSNPKWIENKWDWSVKYPVIHISFEVLDYHEDQLAASIENELN